MAVYGLSFGIRLIWPELAGYVELRTWLTDLGVTPALIGAVVLCHSAVTVPAMLTGADYLRALLASLGAIMWTTISIAQAGMALRSGILPTLALFELIGGVGLSIVTVLFARDPVDRGAPRWI